MDSDFPEVLRCSQDQDIHIGYKLEKYRMHDLKCSNKFGCRCFVEELEFPIEGDFVDRQVMMQRFDSNSSVSSQKAIFVDVMISHIQSFDCQVSSQGTSKAFPKTPDGPATTQILTPERNLAKSVKPPKSCRGQPKADGLPKKNWHGECAVKEHRSFGRSVKSCRECVSASRTYNAHWCSICWRDGLAQFGVPTLTRFKSCTAHARDYATKECPCGRRWTDCLDCRDRGVDLRAGTAFCGRCRRRFGAGKAQFCHCKEPLP